MVSRLVTSILDVGLPLVRSQSSPGGAGEHLDPGLGFPPVSGLSLLCLDADADGILDSSQPDICLRPNRVVIKEN